jgi:hypothetical protein
VIEVAPPSKVLLLADPPSFLCTEPIEILCYLLLQIVPARNGVEKVAVRCGEWVFLEGMAEELESDWVCEILPTGRLDPEAFGLDLGREDLQWSGRFAIFMEGFGLG